MKTTGLIVAAALFIHCPQDARLVAERKDQRLQIKSLLIDVSDDEIDNCISKFGFALFREYVATFGELPNTQKDIISMQLGNMGLL